MHASNTSLVTNRVILKPEDPEELDNCLAPRCVPNALSCGRASQPIDRTPAIDSSRAARLPACPPSYADYILRLLDTKPESCERHQTREPQDHAAPSDRRITTRRRLAGGVRRAGGQRHSVRGSISASVRGAISARVPPSSPSRAARDQHNSPATHSTPHAQHPRAHITMHAPRR